MKILKTQKEYKIISELEILEKLPNKVFEINYNMFGEPFLEESTPIVLPEKIYSNDNTFIEQVLNYYNKTEDSFGVALIGDKGLGKSFTANRLALELNLPVIRITNRTHNATFLKLLDSIEQDKIILIDEFEKIFKEGRDSEDNRLSQESFLTFLDGGGIKKSSRTIFIITSNSDYHISSYLINRPSRIRYRRIYNQLPKEVAIEIIDDLLINPNYKEEILTNISYDVVNIDLLIEIIKEINIQDKPYNEIIENFNYKENIKDYSYRVELETEEGNIVIAIKYFINKVVLPKDYRVVNTTAKNDLYYDIYCEEDIILNPFEKNICKVSYMDDNEKVLKKGVLHLTPLQNNLSSVIF